MTTTSLPSRLSERTFRIYESDLAFIVNSFPKCVRLTPDESKSLNTYVARLRDSILSYTRFNWPSTSIRREEFLACAEQIYITPQVDHVLAGGRAAVLQAIYINSGIDKRTEVENYVPEMLKPRTLDVTDDGINWACYFLAKGIITIPLKANLSESFKNSLEEDYDVVFTREIDGSFTIQ